MTNVIEIEKSDTDLRTLAEKIAAGPCPYSYALDLVVKAYQFGHADGQKHAWKAQQRSDEAAMRERRERREAKHG
jgi:hypothetical protein